MRNSHSKKIISTLLAATLAGFFAMSVMPEIRCKSGECVKSAGNICFDGDRTLIGYKLQIGYDG